jgi:hypothetical protein
LTLPDRGAFDRWCGYFADKPDEDIRELTEHEVAKYERCLGCAG